MASMNARMPSSPNCGMPTRVSQACVVVPRGSNASARATGLCQKKGWVWGSINPGQT